MCLGFLWARHQKSLSESSFTIKTVLDHFALEIENDLLVAKLYTEWGIWLAQQRDASSAEEKFLAVIKHNPKQLPARTELGRLLSRQKGREAEAEKFLREAIKIDPKNLHPRTVLARLYESIDRLPEAKQLYQELCNIDPGNRFGIDGLSRLK
ncbi:tetratricopeptide repeat protein [Acutalibacter muris]|uniref:tetratricopeptide repeat protein n=1 Tax=Acutalibacter muris TaxID=1796620 RepID=UPI00272DFFE4|nr:tetratricopeptide repeat protein [Acutalibacter muris]